MSFWSKFFIAFAITILATTGAVVGVFAGQKEQIDMGGSIKYTVPYFTVEFLNYDDSVFETQQVAYGQDAKKPATDPIRPGYTFSSWTDYTNITQDRRVTANWTKNEAYLLTAYNWHDRLYSAIGRSVSNIKSILFTNDLTKIPSGITAISVGATTNEGTTAWAEGCGVFDVEAYVKPNGSLYDIVFYSPYSIYSPKDSSSFFEDFSSLSSIDFSNFATDYVTDMSGMFMHCSSLTSLNVTGFVTTNVTTMDSMFSSCSSLTSLDVSKFSTVNVKHFSRMFTFCSNIKSLNLSNFSTQSATEMLAMFNECSSLTSLNISTFNTSKVTDMYGMFKNCSSLTSLNLSPFNMSNVVNAERMLAGCSGLTEIKTPKAIGSEIVDLPSSNWRNEANPAAGVYSIIESSMLTSGSITLRPGYAINLAAENPRTGETDNLGYRDGVFKTQNNEWFHELFQQNYQDINYTVANNANYIQLLPKDPSLWTTVGTNKIQTTMYIWGNSQYAVRVPEGYFMQIVQYAYDGTVVGESWTFGNEYVSDGQQNDVKTSINTHTKAYKLQITLWNTGKTVKPSSITTSALSSLYITMESDEVVNVWYGHEIPMPRVYVLGMTYSDRMEGTGFTSSTKDNTLFISYATPASVGTSTHWEIMTPTIYNLYLKTGNATYNGQKGTIKIGSGYAGQSFTLDFTKLTLPDGYYLSKLTQASGSKGVFYINEYETSSSFPVSAGDTSCKYIMGPGDATIQFKFTQNTTSYLRKDWQTALKNKNSNFNGENFKTLTFTKTKPTGTDYTTVSVGATSADGATAYVYNTPTVNDIIAYVKANSSNSSKYDVIIYSPCTIYAPIDSSNLFEIINVSSAAFTNFNTSNVTNMSNMFYSFGDYYPNEISNLDLSGFNTEKVTDMSYMFYESSILSINLTSFNTSNVTNMESMFTDSGFDALDLSLFNTSKVTNMAYMFKMDGCSLTELDLSSFDTSNVTNMSGMFCESDSTSLTKITFSSKFNTSKVTDMSGMFMNQDVLTSLDLSMFTISSSTNVSNMLDRCNSLRTIKTPKSVGAAIDLPAIDKCLWVDNSNVLNIYAQITTSCTNKTLNLVNAPMVTLNSNAQGILKDLDETNGTQITSNNNLNIIYTPEKHIYKLSNTASSDPYATIGQVMYLTAGKKYIMHAEIYSNSGEPITSGSIQVFYAINKGYNEANSKRFSGLSGYETFTVSTTGTYNIRFDNDYGETIWVKNFYVVEETQLTSYVSNNGTYGTLPTPTREYYTFSGWYTAPTGGTNVTETTKISSLNNVTLYAHWIEATYTITIDHNNGTGSTSTIHVPQDPKKQRDYIASLPSISYSGYQFYGLSGSNTAYNASQNLISSLAFSESGLMLCSIVGNATLYGVWVPSSTSYEAMFSLYQKLNENDQDYWTFQTYLGTFDSLIHIITHSTTYSGFRCTLGILKDITLSDGYTITNIPSLQVIACFGSRTITFSENNKYFIFNGSYDIKFGGNGRNLTITNSGDKPVCSISTMESMESKLYTQRFVLASGAYINYGITGLSLGSSSGNPSPYGYNVLDSFGGTLNHYTIVSPLHRSVNIFGGTVKKIASITGGIYFHNNPDGNIQIDAGENSLNASNSLTFFHTKITSYNVYIDRLNTDGEGFTSKTKVAIAADPTYFNGKVQSSKQYIIYEDKVAYVYPYPVVLDKNGGSGTMPTVSVNSGDKTKFTISTSKTGPLLTKNGKQLYYWSTVSTDTEASQTGVRYDAGYSYTYGGGIHPTVLYATYLTPSADSYFTFTESGSGYIVNYTNKSTSLTNCVVPQYHNSKPVIGLADSCFNAASIHGILTLPSSLTSLGYASTGWMRGITKIYFPSNITSMGRCNFVACSAMQDIIINQAANFATYEGVLYSADYSRLYAVPCAKPIGFWKNFTTASYLSLCDSSAYETLSLPSSLKTMEETVFSYNSVKLIRIQSSSLTINSGEFSNCNNLNYILCTNKSVAVYLEGQSANKKGKFFYKTSSYASNISWTLLANNYYISSDGIYAKDPDGNVYRKYETPTGYLDIRNNVVYGFLSTVDATKYAEIDIPAGVTAINASAFQGKTTLQTVNFTDTQLNTIGNYAFDGCTSLKTLNGYTRSTRVTSIGSYAFRGTKIERVIIPSTVTSVGAGAFANSSAIIAEVYCSYATFGSGLFSGTGLKIIYGASSSSGMYSNLAANLGITKLEYAFFSDSNTNEAGSSLRDKTTNSYYSGTTNPKGIDYTEKTDSTPVPGYLERVRRGITIFNLKYSYAKLHLSFGTYYFSA